ncbi:hypothetical protein BJ508DRAFT_309627 [Ascobolus immersus RN42]|uniref:Uncharacterized protein n=1 Tax=Ascobolus immersus RN42 TaxID=1160509 RepID=A0A3N4HW41_ASCIM|nr:hypothetical protein BJ508DRAFT_309627 [Ascobolus immersus RN42]
MDRQIEIPSGGARTDDNEPDGRGPDGTGRTEEMAPWLDSALAGSYRPEWLGQEESGGISSGKQLEITGRLWIEPFGGCHGRLEIGGWLVRHLQRPIFPFNMTDETTTGPNLRSRHLTTCLGFVEERPANSKPRGQPRESVVEVTCRKCETPGGTTAVVSDTSHDDRSCTQVFLLEFNVGGAWYLQF